MAGAVDGLTRGLAVDLAPVRVNVIAPGLVRRSFLLCGSDRMLKRIPGQDRGNTVHDIVLVMVAE